MEPAEWLPAGKVTVPPPLALHFSMAALIAGVSLAVPSPAFHPAPAEASDAIPQDKLESN